MNKQNIRLILIALAALVLLVIVAQNLERQTVSVLFMEISMPLALLLIGTAIIGYIGGLLSAGVLFSRKRKAKAGDGSSSK